MIEINFKNAVWFGIILVSAGISYGMVSQKLIGSRNKATTIRKGNNARHTRNKRTSNTARNTCWQQALSE